MSNRIPLCCAMAMIFDRSLSCIAILCPSFPGAWHMRISVQAGALNQACSTLQVAICRRMAVICRPMACLLGQHRSYSASSNMRCCHDVREVGASQPGCHEAAVTGLSRKRVEGFPPSRGDLVGTISVQHVCSALRTLCSLGPAMLDDLPYKTYTRGYTGTAQPKGRSVNLARSTAVPLSLACLMISMRWVRWKQGRAVCGPSCGLPSR